MTHPATILTDSGFATEPLAWEAFDRLVAASEAFHSYSEVDGEYLFPRLGTEARAARIDRVLVPKLKALQAGWVDGLLGVEGKRSETKIGPVIAQAMDYSRCGFWSPAIPGMMVLLRWVFIYPLAEVHGDLGSVMAQNRIGYATINHTYNHLTFGCGGMWGLRIEGDGRIQAKPLPMGNRRGSR